MSSKALFNLLTSFGVAPKTVVESASIRYVAKTTIHNIFLIFLNHPFIKFEFFGNS